MRTFRVTLALVAALCGFGTLAAPALAGKHKTRPPATFGKFIASYPSHKPISASEPAIAKGTGEIETLSLLNGGLVIELCNKELKSSGRVISERSETFYQNVKFLKCFASVRLGKSGFVDHIKLPNFTIGMEFHSNGSVVVGQEEESETEVRIKPGTTVSIPIGKKGPCVALIPEQTIPIKALKKPEKVFDAASYSTEENTEVKLKKFPRGFQEKLEIDLEFSKVRSEMKPSELCEYEGGSAPNAKGNIEYKNGIIEGFLEEIEIKNGNVGFETKEEVEAEV